MDLIRISNAPLTCCLKKVTQNITNQIRNIEIKKFCCRSSRSMFNSKTKLLDYVCAYLYILNVAF